MGVDFVSKEKFPIRFLVVVLAVCLGVSLIVNGYFYVRFSNRLEEGHSPTSFSFVWGPTAQKIVNGTLYLNLTFDVVGGNLTVKTEVNGGAYNPNAVLALQFDSDNNGTIDIPGEEHDYWYSFDKGDSQFLLRSNNKTRQSNSPYWDWLPNGTIWLGNMLKGVFEYESVYHFCTYKDGIYTFFFTFPIAPTTFDFDVKTNGSRISTDYSWLNGEHGIQGKLARILYCIAPPEYAVPQKGMTVYVPPFKFME